MLIIQLQRTNGLLCKGAAIPEPEPKQRKKKIQGKRYKDKSNAKLTKSIMYTREQQSTLVQNPKQSPGYSSIIIDNLQMKYEKHMLKTQCPKGGRRGKTKEHYELGHQKPDESTMKRS